MILLKIGADINIQIDSICGSETKMLLDLHKKIFFTIYVTKTSYAHKH